VLPPMSAFLGGRGVLTGERGAGEGASEVDVLLEQGVELRAHPSEVGAGVALDAVLGRDGAGEGLGHPVHVVRCGAQVGEGCLGVPCGLGVDGVLQGDDVLLDRGLRRGRRQLALGQRLEGVGELLGVADQPLDGVLLGSFVTLGGGDGVVHEHVDVAVPEPEELLTDVGAVDRTDQVGEIGGVALRQLFGRGLEARLVAGQGLTGGEPRQVDVLLQQAVQGRPQLLGGEVDRHRLHVVHVVVTGRCLGAGIDVGVGAGVLLSGGRRFGRVVAHAAGGEQHGSGDGRGGRS
jgi:hypothetical protein